MKKIFLLLTLSLLVFSFSPEGKTNKAVTPTTPVETVVMENAIINYSSISDDNTESCLYVFDITWTGTATYGAFGYEIERTAVINNMISFGLYNRVITGDNTETWTFRAPCDPWFKTGLETAIQNEPRVDVSGD